MQFAQLSVLAFMVHSGSFSLISSIEELPVQISDFVNLCFDLAPVFVSKRLDYTVMTLVSIVGLLSDLIFQPRDSRQQLLLFE